MHSSLLIAFQCSLGLGYSLVMYCFDKYSMVRLHHTKVLKFIFIFIFHLFNSPNEIVNRFLIVRSVALKIFTSGLYCAAVFLNLAG